jgi:hypothetical protein
MGCPQLTTTAKSPKLTVLRIEGCEAELFAWVARHITTLTYLVLNSLKDSTETNSVAAEHGLRVDSQEKQNDHGFPLASLVLSDSKSGAIELYSCFAQLQDLSIHRCDALVHWPEEVFQGFVSLRKLVIIECKNLTGYAEASVEPSTSSEMIQLLPRLQSLRIDNCNSLVEVFSIPAFLRKMVICHCSKLESTSGRRLQQRQSASSIHQGSSSVLEYSSPSSRKAWAEHLEELRLEWCAGLTGVLHLPSSLKEIDISNCGGLTSLESHSGELPLLEHLHLWKCNNLSSIPDGPQSYSSLQVLYIYACPGTKMLPRSLQQRLGNIREEGIDAHYYGSRDTTLTFSSTTSVPN